MKFSFVFVTLLSSLLLIDLATAQSQSRVPAGSGTRNIVEAAPAAPNAMPMAQDAMPMAQGAAAVPMESTPLADTSSCSSCNAGNVVNSSWGGCCNNYAGVVSYAPSNWSGYRSGFRSYNSGCNNQWGWRRSYRPAWVGGWRYSGSACGCGY